ncbi:VanZ family protein [Marinobacterium jannaschii]|uniref:VanZ family protein n=1 Tax=Marinobacterium jannaschii TaxID=64970 RepID=UPI0006840F73|nr:VanZ family protein [Marinobacterium jannaschii]
MPLVLILLGITVLSLLPIAGLPEKTGFTDKQSHFIAWGSAALVGFTLFPRAGWRILLLLLFWGVAIEYAQQLIPKRQFSGLDVIANTLGIVLGWGAAMLLRRLRYGRWTRQE